MKIKETARIYIGYRNAYELAETDEKKQELKYSMRKLLEAVNNESEPFRIVFEAYTDMYDKRNTDINLTDLWLFNIPEIIEFLRANSIYTFTVSDRSTALMDNIWSLKSAGCEIADVVEINRYKYDGGSPVKVPALLFIVK